jgi:hypothetical protein
VRAEQDFFALGTGRDGARTITAANTQINTYTALGAAATVGATQLTVTSAAGIAAGDLIMVWQTQRPAAGAPAIGVQADASLDTLAVGQWEFARVASVAGNTLTLTAGLQSAYLAVGAQVIRVPEYTTLTINAAASAVAKPWDGVSGGIIIALVQGELTNNGTISAASAGFRGGVRTNGPTVFNCTSLTEAGPAGAQRGESLLVGAWGASATGRGNHVHGGGGGVCHNAGGAGGGHVAQGGKGGRSFSGDGARDVGGLGGARLIYNPSTRLMMGGGGGAGEANNNANTDGGHGGGVVFMRAGSVAGIGTILVNGQSAATGANDGQGGGGAAGAIVLRAAGQAVCGGLSANGGDGGSMTASQHGPGGGGSGGLIARQSAGGTCNTSVTGGLAGVQTDTAAPDGIHYGAQPTPANRAMFAGLVTTFNDAFTIAAPAANTTTSTTPTISGTTTPNTRVRIIVDGVVIGTVTSNAQGAWTFTPMTPLADGAHTVAAQAEGSIIVVPARSINVDAVAPSIAFSSPAAGAITNDTTPTISGSTEPGATVRVTINGTVLTTTANAQGQWSVTPNTPLADGPVNVSATATDGVGNVSQPVTRSFTIDATAPLAPTIASPANGAVLSMTPLITGTAEPNATVTVLVDGMPVGTVTANAQGQWSLMLGMMLADGPHTITASATDAANNTSPNATSSFTIDTVAPLAVVINAPAMGAVTGDNTPTISGSAEPGATVTVTVNGALLTTTANAQGAWSVTPTTPLADGLILVSATASDAAGNTSQPTATSFTIDTIAPAAVVISSPADGATLSAAPATISGSAEPGATVAVVVDGMMLGMTIADMSGVWSIAAPAMLADGPHTLSATATDAAGNTNQPTFTSFTIVRLFVDLTAPALTNDDTPALSGTTQPGATVTILIDGVMVGTATADMNGAWTFEPPAALMEGARMVVARVDDGMGLIAEDTASVVIDLTPPALAISSPVDGSATNIEQPTISGTAEPGATITITLDDGQTGTVTADANGDWSFVPAQPLPFGPTLVTVVATDKAGNTSMDTATVTVVDDMSPLDLTITNPANGSTISTAKPTLIGQTAPGASVEIFVDGVLVGTTTADQDGVWQFSIPADKALPDGMHTLEARATSGQDTARVAITVTVMDIITADVLITAPAMGALTNDDTPTISGTAEPGATVEVFVDGALVGKATADMNGAWTLEAPMLTDGEHTIRATSRGKESSVTITVDTMAPVTTVTAPTTGGTVMTGTPVISGTGEPGSTVTILIDGMEVGTVVVGQDGMWTFTPTTPLGEGEHTIVVVGKDEAGNSLELPGIVITVEEPGEAPMVGITSPAPGMTVTTATPTISGTANPGATVEIVVDGVVIGTVVADANGAWSFTPTAPLAEGEHTIEARVTIDGQTSTAGPITITVDVPGEEPEDSAMILTGRESCATVPAGEVPAGGLGLLGVLLGLIGWRRRC